MVLALLPFLLLALPLMGQQTGCADSPVMISEQYSCNADGGPGCSVTVYYPRTGGSKYQWKLKQVACPTGCSAQYAPSFGFVGSCSAVADAWPGLRKIAGRKDILLATCDGSLLPIEDQRELFADTKIWSLPPQKVELP
jgi:hypothetical protein